MFVSNFLQMSLAYFVDALRWGWEKEGKYHLDISIMRLTGNIFRLRMLSSKKAFV